MRIAISAISRKGRNRIRESGGITEFDVIDIADTVQFDSGRGPWLHIKDETHNVNRWVHQYYDVDFDVTDITPKEI